MDRQYLDREMEKVLGRPGMHLPDQVDLRGDDGARWLKFVRLTVGSDTRPGRRAAQRPGGRSALRRRGHGIRPCRNARKRGHGATRQATYRQAGARRDARRPGPRVDRSRDGGGGGRQRTEIAGGISAVPWAGVRRNACSTSVSSGSMQIWWMPTTRRRSPDVAVRWGFTHTGRFASSFRRKYGLLPSEVLRRASFGYPMSALSWFAFSTRNRRDVGAESFRGCSSRPRSNTLSLRRRFHRRRGREQRGKSGRLPVPPM